MVFRHVVLLTCGALLVAGCRQATSSYQPEAGGQGEGGQAIYNLNCRNGDLDGCNQTAIAKCAEQGLNAYVSSHFVSGSEVMRLTFYCTTGPTQLVPDAIRFDDGQGAN